MVARQHATKGSALANNTARGVLWLGRGPVPFELERLAASAGFSLRPRTDAAWPPARVAWLQHLPAIRRDHGSLARRRIAVLHPDPGASDALAEALRALGARAIVLGLPEQGLVRAEALDPEVIIVSPTHLDVCRSMLDTLWAHLQLRWTPMLFVPDERLGPAGLDAPDVRELAVAVGMLCAEHVFLGRRAQMEAQFAIALHMLGPTRTLAALVETGRPLRACFRGDGPVVEVDLSEGIVVGARGGEKEPEEASLLGVHALSAVYALTHGSIVVRHVEHPAVTNVMAPLETLLLGGYSAPPLISDSPRRGLPDVGATTALGLGVPRTIADARPDNRALPSFIAGAATSDTLHGQPGLPGVPGRALWAGTVPHRETGLGNALEHAVAVALNEAVQSTGAGPGGASAPERIEAPSPGAEPPATGVAVAGDAEQDGSPRGRERGAAVSEGPWIEAQTSEDRTRTSKPAARAAACDETAPEEFTETWVVRPETTTRLPSQTRRRWRFLLIPALLCGGLVMWGLLGSRARPPNSASTAPFVARPRPAPRAALSPPAVPVTEATPKAEALPLDPTHTKVLPVDKPHAEALPVDKPHAEALPVDKPHAEALPVDKPHAEVLPVDKPHAEALPVGKPKAELAPGEKPKPLLSVPPPAAPGSPSSPYASPKPAAEARASDTAAAAPVLSAPKLTVPPAALSPDEAEAEAMALAEAAVVRGHMLRRGGDVRAAQEAYLEALAVVPEFPRALAGLAEAYLAQRNQAPALDAAQRLLARRKRFPDDLRLLGDIYMLDGRVVEATEAYARASQGGSLVARERLKDLVIH